MRLTLPWRKPDKAPAAAMPSGAVSLSGRPTYASAFGTQTFLTPEFSVALMQTAYRTVPVFKRAIEILTGLVGDPSLVGVNDRHSADLEAWAEGVQFGRVSTGLCPFLADHASQELLYGYGVGEAEIAAPRNGVAALWSYLSPHFQFETRGDGSFDIVQFGGFGIKRTLNPETAFVSTYASRGSSPVGESLFAAALNVSTTWGEVVFAHRNTWRRSGTPAFAITIKPPEGFNDPKGTLGTTIAASFESAWNEAIRSSVEDGIVKDHFWFGEAAVSTIGGDVAAMQFEISNRALLEQIVLATGIPPFILGLNWSSTERMSDQQANALSSLVESIRYSIEPNIRKVVDLHQRLTGRIAEYLVDWPESSLFDRLTQARANVYDADAALKKQDWALKQWQLGIFDQSQVAEHTTGMPDVAEVLTEPPSMAPVAPQPESEIDPEADPAGDEQRGVRELAYSANGHGTGER